jgi:hypothetical protein
VSLLPLATFVTFSVWESLSEKVKKNLIYHCEDTFLQDSLSLLTPLNDHPFSLEVSCSSILRAKLIVEQCERYRDILECAFGKTHAISPDTENRFAERFATNVQNKEKVCL